ncbi:hypothetical protein HPULCUR_010108 [Helicostylum pulchrum]|uniref:BAG domain-containing protein n=1 Tax=Helicostylum pulchrum TaxID=562976 RepID=A0ABP9YCD7_9FUNG
MIIVNDKTLTLDDFIQLQALLNYEHAERDRHIWECQSNKEPAIYIQKATPPPRYVQFRRDINAQASLQSSLERARLAEALMRLKWLKDQYRRQRALEVQLYLENYRRQALIRSVLEEEEERYYRQCIAAAVEKARIQLCLQRFLESKQQQQEEWNEQPAEVYQQPIEAYGQPVEAHEQPDEEHEQSDEEHEQSDEEYGQPVEGYDASRTERLENLLQYIFDHQNLREVGYEKQEPTEEEQAKDMAQVWKFLSDQRENEDNDERMSSDEEYEGEYDDDEEDSEDHAIDDDMDDGMDEEDASPPPSLVEQLRYLQQQHQQELQQHQQELKQYEQQEQQQLNQQQDERNGQQQDEQQQLEHLQQKQHEKQHHEQEQLQLEQNQEGQKPDQHQRQLEQQQQQLEQQKKQLEQQQEKQQEQQPSQEEESNQASQMKEQETPQDTQPENEPENHHQKQQAIHKKQYKHQQKKKKRKHKRRHQHKQHAASSQDPNKETEFPPIQDHVVPLQKLIQRLASEPVLIGEQRTEFSDEPKPSGIWAKEVPAKKSPPRKQSPTLVPVSTKAAFLPQHIFTEAEPTPTLENMPNTPLGAQEEEEQEQEGFEHFVNTVAAEQKNEEVPTDPRKVKAYQELEKVADLLSDPESEIVKRWLFVLQGGKDGKQRLDFSKQKEGTLLLSASTPFNRQFLGSEDELLRTMLRLDAVDSFGDASIREERKKLVKKCEDMLEDLDNYKQSQWEKAMIKNK